MQNTALRSRSDLHPVSGSPLEIEPLRLVMPRLIIAETAQARQRQGSTSQKNFFDRHMERGYRAEPEWYSWLASI